MNEYPILKYIFALIRKYAAGFYKGLVDGNNRINISNGRIIIRTNSQYRSSFHSMKLPNTKEIVEMLRIQ